MCGIAGYLGLDDERLLRAMARCLTHRGPDDEGFFVEPGVGLASRRLSVIDLATGRQPMSNEDGTVHVVFNGEIYNYEELTRDLVRRGHRFRSTCDTETIVHLYEERGTDFVHALRGMFAIALWDSRRRRLVLVRDRIGEKPLFYAQRDGVLLFGSEIKAILQRRGPRAASAQAVCEFLAAGYVPAPRTFYDGICKLPPGHMLVAEEGRVDVRRYWQRGDARTGRLSFDEASRRLAAMLSHGVRLCLKSDVEVGGFLSGGIDSSVIVALMHHHAARVRTFSVGYRGRAAGFNELQFARQIARQFNTEHHELILGPHSTVELLPRILWHYDEPHGEPTSVLVYLLCEFTRRFVTVALCGTGGDEIFYGYPRHAGIRLLGYYRLLPRIVREQLVGRVVTRWPESTGGSRFAKRARRFVGGADLLPAQAYLSWVSLIHPDLRAQLLSPRTREAAPDPSGDRFLRDYLVGRNGDELLDRAADLDVEAYLPEYQLAYMDRMSMAHGLEARSPLCDFELVDFVTSLPASYRLRGTHSKHIFKVIAQRWIPRSIAERKKVGFDSPVGQWFKDELRAFVERFLSREHVERTGLLTHSGVQQLFGDHLTGRRDYSLQLWSLLALEAWHRMYIEDEVTDASHYRLADLRGADPTALPAHARSQAPPNPGAQLAAGARRRLARQSWSRKKLWEESPASLRRALAPLVRALPVEVFLGRRFRECYEFVRKAERWDAERIRQRQLAALRRVLQIAWERSRFYRRSFDRLGFHPRDLTDLETLRQLPVIDKETIRAHLDEMCTVRPTSAGVDFVSTGGTGGQPLHFFIGADRSAVEYAYLVAGWNRAGYALGAPMAVFRGRVVQPDASGLRHDFDPLLRHHHYSNFHMTDESIARYLEHVRTIGPCFLHVYPSAAAALARFLIRTSTPPPRNVRAIIAESEIVYADQRRLVAETFGCRYFSCYGHSEKLVAAAGCEHSDDYHVWPTYGYFELLDAQGQPVTTPGERGEIVGTGFINTVVPFVRYRTGDFATYVADRCDACGRNHPVIRDIRGHRTQEVLVAADGSEISWTALNMHDETFLRVRQFQFFQDTPGQALLRIVPTNGFGPADRERIVSNLDRKLDQRVRIRVELTDAIPLSPGGKAIYVDQQIGRAGAATQAAP